MGRLKRQLDKAPENWLELAEGHIRRRFTKWKADRDKKGDIIQPRVEKIPPPSPQALAESLKRSPATSGSLTPGANRGGSVDAARCERWLANREVHLKWALVFLAGAEEAAGWLAAEARKAKKGLVTAPDVEDKQQYALQILAYEICAVAELYVDDITEVSLRPTAEEIKKIHHRIAELSRFPDLGINFDLVAMTRAVGKSPAWHKRKGRPPKRSQEAIYQLTERNKDAFGHPVPEATSILLRLAFPHREWSPKAVLGMYQKTRKQQDLNYADFTMPDKRTPAAKRAFKIPKKKFADIEKPAGKEYDKEVKAAELLPEEKREAALEAIGKKYRAKVAPAEKELNEEIKAAGQL